MSSVSKIVLSGLFFFSLESVAFAQSNDLNSRINRLENEISTLSRSVYRGEQPPPSAFTPSQNNAVQADMQVRIGNLEQELRILTGRLEQQDFEIQQLKSEIEKLSTQLAQKPVNTVQPTIPQPQNNAQTLPPSAAADTNLQTTQAAQQEAQAFQLPSGSASEHYEAAFSLIRNKDFGAAEGAFSSFLEKYPDHALAPNAKYWLGETFYVRDNYERAARIFAEAYQKYPKGPKGADNLLKLGLSLAGLGKKEDACVALKQLKIEYPAGPLPILRRGEQEQASLGCVS